MAGPLPTPGTEALPADLAGIASRVEARVAHFLDHERQRWATLDHSLVEPLDALGQLVMAGGKRLRPAFCHWGFVGAGGDAADPAVVDAGAAFELLQGFALVHDDIMDGSAVRRGAPSVHRRFDDRHRDAGWSGEGRRFGEGAALLIGDLALVYADRLLPPGPPELGALWDELRIELNIGQYLDLVGTATGRSDRAHARLIARYKSGKYTIERPLHLGAVLAGRADLVEPLSRYGDPLGEAFQLRDDILGVFGDSLRTGKPVGDDLREGKPTVLLAAAHERADADQRQLLGRVGEPGLDGDVVTQLQQVLIDTGARQEVETAIAELGARAVAALDDVALGDDALTALRDLAGYVVGRDA